MGASPLRRTRVRPPTTFAAVCAVLVLLLAGVQEASAGPRRVHLTGTYRAVAVDGYDWGRTDHYVVAGGTSYLLQRGGDPPNFPSGTRVEVDGTLSGSRLDADSVVPVAGAATQSTAAPAAARLAPVTHSVLAILVDWTAPDSVTPTSAVHQLKDVNDAWYDDASYGQVRMTASATNWLTIPTPSGCATGSIMSNAQSAATSAGWNLGTYDHLLVYFPYTSDCGFAGMAGVGWGQVWINGYLDTRVTVHELGHNLGLYHAHSVACTQASTAVPWSTSCTLSEYGDPFDAMGGSFWGGVGRFNASQANLLGWMQGRKQTADTGGGTYLIAPLEQRTEAIQGLRLPGTPHDIWIEYRRASGIDSWLPAGATTGVLLHLPDVSNGGSDFLDMTPADGDVTNAVLRPGHAWVDPATNWAIRVDDLKPSGATVTVAKPPDATPPTFTMAPRISFASPQQLPKRGKPASVRVVWAAKDAADSVNGYDVRTSTDGGAWSTLATDDMSTSTTIAAAPGHTYAVEVRALDGWGNASAWTAAPAISLSTLADKRLSYEGRWSKRHDRQALGNTYRLTTRARATAVLHVSGRAVAVLARVGPRFGSVRVVVDGHRGGTFSQRARRNGYRQVTFRLSWTRTGAHTIRLVNVGSRGHPSFSIDGVAVLA